VSLRYPSHLYFAIQKLAHWIYTGDGLDSGVSERQLIDSTADYLADYCAEDRAEAEAAAKDFVAFCRGRARVFSEAGTSDIGERLYAFTHRTFLEFFTASHLVRNAGGPEPLAVLLVDQVSEGNWDVVAQLAFHIQDQAQAGSADVMINRFLAAAKQAESKDATFRLYDFLARCLRFLVPRPPVRRALVEDFLEFWLGREYRPRTNHPPTHPSSGQPVFFELANAAEENRATIVAAICDVTSALITRGSDNTPGLEAAAELALLADRLRDHGVDAAPEEMRTKIFDDDFFARHASVLDRLGHRDARFATFLGASNPAWSALKILQTHGLQTLLSTSWASLLNIGFGGQVESVLRFLSFSKLYSDRLASPDLIGVGEHLPQLPLPWIAGCQRIDPETTTGFFPVGNEQAIQTIDIDRGVLFLGFAVGAVSVECASMDDGRRRVDANHFLKFIEAQTDFSGPIAHLVPPWRARLSSAFTDENAIDWHALRFSPEQQRLARDWMAGKIAFVGNEAQHGG
jgi:hypothetical protein